MLMNLILIIYIIISLLVIIFILMSRGKGAAVGATFNSSSIDLFGSKGSNSIINKIIVVLYVILLIINISLNMMNKNIKEKDLDHTLNIDKYKTKILK